MKDVYVFVSAFEDEDSIVPVKLEVKEFKDKPNKLYVAVSLNPIKKTEVSGQRNTENGVTESSRSVNISISQLFKKVNVFDGSFLKYIPDLFLTEEQIIAKNKKIAEDEANDKKRNSYKQAPKVAPQTPVEKVKAAAVRLFCKERIPEYEKLTAPEREAVEMTVRQARGLGVSDADAAIFGRVAAKSGMNVFVIEYLKGENAFYNGNNGIYISAAAERSKVFSGLLGHEMFHKIFKSNGKKAQKLFNEACKLFADKKKKEEIRKSYTDYYRSLEYKEEDIKKITEEEVAAAYSEEIFGIEGVWEYILAGEPSIKDKVLSFFVGARKKYAFEENLSRDALKYLKRYRKLFSELAEKNAGRSAFINSFERPVDFDSKPEGETDKEGKRSSVAGVNSRSADIGELIKKEIQKGNLLRIKKRSTQDSERTATHAGGFVKNASVNSIPENQEIVKRSEKKTSEKVDDGRRSSLDNYTEEEYNNYGLTDDEVAALLAYKSGGSYTVNAKLREGIKLSDYERKIVEALNSGLKKLPKYQGHLYRNIGFDRKMEVDKLISEHIIGEIISYDSFTSTSTEKDSYLLDSDYPVHFEIESFTGRDLNGYGNNFESEVLFPTDSLFVVKGIKYDRKGTPTIYLTEEVNEQAEISTDGISEAPAINNRGQQKIPTESNKGKVQRLQEANTNDGEVRAISERDTQRNMLQQGDLRELRAEVNNDDGRRSSLDNYTEEEYNNYGWARYNDVVSASENIDLTSKFAAVVTKLAKYPKTKAGEYMIAIGDYDIQNKIAFIKGKIDDPYITRVLIIDENNETKLDEIRRETYALERRGIQQKVGVTFYTYTSASFRRPELKSGGYVQSQRYNDGFGTERRGNSGKTPRVKEYIFKEDGTIIKKYNPDRRSSVRSDGELAKMEADYKNDKVYSKSEAEKASNDLIKAIERGIITEMTKTRLKECIRYYNNDRISTKLKEMSPAYFRTHLVVK